MVITISRQYGSRGRDIGKALADRLDIGFYDKELIELASKESGINPEHFEKYDEKAGNSLLYSLSVGASATVSSEYGASPELPINDRLYLIQHDIIRKAAEEPCVIVGRCADHVLSDRRDCVRVFIYADMEYKVRHLEEKFSLSPEKARSVIKKHDRTRANYYNHFASGKWGDPQNYELCINSAKLGVNASASLIIEYLRLRSLV